MIHGRVEHPADFEKDAVLFGGLTITQLVVMAPAVAIGLVAILGLLLRQPLLWEWYIIAITVVVLIFCLEVSHRLRRRITLAAAFAWRPRWRQSDGSRPVTTHSQETVQDLAKVAACAGPFVQFLDGRMAMVLRVQPPPSVCVSGQQEETMRLRFQKALQRAAQAGAEITIYQEVEPDLNRGEIDRNLAMAERLPPESGLRRLTTERQLYHGSVATEWGRRLAYHLRLMIRSEQVPLMAAVQSNAERTEAVLGYLREIGMGIASEIGQDGVKVQPLGPEGVRNLMTKQLDPAGWLTAEPVRGIDWAWTAGGEQPVWGAAARTLSEKEAAGHAYRPSAPRTALGTLAFAALEVAPRKEPSATQAPLVEPVQWTPQPVASRSPRPVAPLHHPIGRSGRQIGYPVGLYRGHGMQAVRPGRRDPA